MLDPFVRDRFVNTARALKRLTAWAGDDSIRAIAEHPDVVGHVNLNDPNEFFYIRGLCHMALHTDHWKDGTFEKPAKLDLSNMFVIKYYDKDGNDIEGCYGNPDRCLREDCRCEEA